MDDDLQKTLQQLLGLLIIVALVSGPLWLLALRKRQRGRPLLEFQPRRHVPWGLIDLALVVALVVLVNLAAGALLSSVWQIDRTVKLEYMPADDRAAVLLASAIASLVAAAVALLSIKAKTLARGTDFGFDWSRVRRDLSIGVTAFFMLAPPVYLMQGVLAAFWKKSEHPLIELILKQPDLKFFVVSGISAVIVAPLVEEFLFRGLLQGWLEKVPGYRGDASRLLVGECAVNPPAKLQEVEGASDSKAAHDPSDNPYASPHSHRKVQEEFPEENLARPTVWPILVSAAVFALMHFSHGPDPIPLFFLAVGLGYMFQRTHSLLPCIVVHFLLNAASLVMLLAQVYGPNG